MTPAPCSSTQHWGKPASKWNPGVGEGEGRGRQRNGECIAPLPLSLGHLIHLTSFTRVLTQFLLWRKMLASSEPPVPWRCYLAALENFQHRGQLPPSSLWPTLRTGILPNPFLEGAPVGVGLGEGRWVIILCFSVNFGQ